MKTILVRLLAVMTVLISAAASVHAEGENVIFANPNPDRTWTKQVGGFLNSAKSYAVVISISNYVGTKNGGYGKLDTRNDAEKMKNFLLQDMGFDYVRLITDAEVTKGNLDAVMLDEIRPLVGPSDRFVFYWSGHGEQLERPDDRSVYGFLPLYNSKVKQFSSMISMDDIARWNSYLQARHALFILDACLSGLAGVKTKSTPRMDQLSLPARFLLTAGTSKEEVIANERWGGSLFTDALIKVVRQHAQASEAVVSIYRIFDEVQERVAVEKEKAHWPGAMTPQLKDLQGGGGAFFFSTKPASTIVPQLSAELVSKPAVGDSKSLLADQNAPKGSEPVDGLKPSSAMTGQPASAGKGRMKPSAPFDPISQFPIYANSKSVNHCENIGKKVLLTIGRDNPFRVGVLDNSNAPKTAAVSIDDALSVHLGASARLFYRYVNNTGESATKMEFDLPGMLSGSFDVITSMVPKCDGKVLIRRQTLLENSAVVAVIYSYSYRSETLFADKNSLLCIPPDGEFYDVREAYDGLVKELSIDKREISVSDGPGFKRRTAKLENSIIGFTSVIEDDGYDEPKGPKIRHWRETIVHPANEYQQSATAAHHN